MRGDNCRLVVHEGVIWVEHECGRADHPIAAKN